MRQKAKNQAKYGPNSDVHKMVYETYKEMYAKKDSTGYKDLLSMSRMSSSIYRPESSRHEAESSFHLPKKSSMNSEMDSQKPDLSRKWSQVSAISYVDESILSIKQPQNDEYDVNRDTITVTVVFMYEESNPDNKEAPTSFPEQEFRMIIHKKRDVQDIWAKTHLWL